MSGDFPALRVDSLPDELFVELAIGINSFHDVCDNYGIDISTADEWAKDPMFMRRVRLATSAVDDDGTAFAARCRTSVLNSVGNIANLIKDGDVSASTQLDAFKTLTRYAGLEPAKAEYEKAKGPMLTLNITAPDGAHVSLHAPGENHVPGPMPAIVGEREVTGAVIDNVEPQKNQIPRAHKSVSKSFRAS